MTPDEAVVLHVLAALFQSSKEISEDRRFFEESRKEHFLALCAFAKSATYTF
jgi:hypothetical protein